MARHNPLLDQNLYQRIFDAIMERRLTPGTRLEEQRLGEIFKVSRTVVRKALLRLQHEGVVEIAANRGAWVAQTSETEARQVFEARRVAEAAAVELACRRINRSGIRKLEKLHRDELRAYGKKDRGTGIRLSGELHLAVACAADNQPLFDFIRSLVSRTSLIIAQYESSNPAICPYDEHAALILTIRSGNMRPAKRAMIEHLNHIEANLDFSRDDEDHDLANVFRLSA